MNANRISVYSFIGLCCLLLTQPACAVKHRTLTDGHQKAIPHNLLPQPAQKSIAQTRNITFSNKITPPMLVYTYLFIKYSPSRFNVTINGETIEPGQEKTIKVTNNTIKVQYYFEFGSHRSGTRAIEYSVAQTPATASLTFAWKKKIRITIDGATPLSAVELVVA